MPQKYSTVGGVATLIHHRGPTTLPGTPPQTSQGAAILCLHDAGSNGNQFGSLMDHLAAAHSPMAFDQPGHGRSGGLDAMGSVADMADQVHELSTAWDISSPVLVGEGLGAAVALQAASAHPDWVRALVLVGGAAASFDLDAEIGQLAAITSGKARREFDRTGYAPDTDRSVYQRAFAEWVKTDPRATLGARRAQAAWSLPVPGPDVPTLIVVGEHEDESGVAAAGELAGRLPQAEVRTLPAAGRRGVLEQPEALAGLVNDFLAGIEEGQP